jgi:hypothetical protein
MSEHARQRSEQSNTVVREERRRRWIPSAMHKQAHTSRIDLESA